MCCECAALAQTFELLQLPLHSPSSLRLSVPPLLIYAVSSRATKRAQFPQLKLKLNLNVWLSFGPSLCLSLDDYYLLLKIS